MAPAALTSLTPLGRVAQPILARSTIRLAYNYSGPRFLLLSRHRLWRSGAGQRTQGRLARY